MSECTDTRTDSEQTRETRAAADHAHMKQTACACACGQEMELLRACAHEQCTNERTNNPSSSRVRPSLSFMRTCSPSSCMAAVCVCHSTSSMPSPAQQAARRSMRTLLLTRTNTQASSVLTLNLDLLHKHTPVKKPSLCVDLETQMLSGRAAPPVPSHLMMGARPPTHTISQPAARRQHRRRAAWPTPLRATTPTQVEVPGLKPEPWLGTPAQMGVRVCVCLCLTGWLFVMCIACLHAKNTRASIAVHTTA